MFLFCIFVYFTSRFYLLTATCQWEGKFNNQNLGKWRSVAMAQDNLAMPTETPEAKFIKLSDKPGTYMPYPVMIPTGGHMIGNIFGLSSLVGQNNNTVIVVASHKMALHQLENEREVCVCV